MEKKTNIADKTTRSIKPFSYIKDPRTQKNYSLDSKEGIELLLKYVSVNNKLTQK